MNIEARFRAEIDVLRRRIDEEPDGYGRRLSDLPYYRSALAEIEIELAAWCAVRARLAHEPATAIRRAVADRLAADLGIRVVALEMEVLGVARAADRSALGHNEVGRGETGLIDRYVARLHEQAAAESSSTRMIIDNLLRR